MGTVTCIDDGDVGDLGSILGGTFDEMAHHDDVGIVGDHQDGIFQRLAFRAAGNFRVGKSYYSST